MYCKNCGKEINENADFCIHCGAAVKKESVQAVSPTDAPSGGFAVLSFFFPIIGLILYLVWKTESPLKAKSCGKGALISVIVGAVGAVFGFICFAFAMSIAVSNGAYYLLPTLAMLI